MNRAQRAKTIIEGASAASLSPEAVEQLLTDTDLSVDELMLELVPLAHGHARPAISNYSVGAVGLGLSGALYFGANFEFAGSALANTVHAEQAVVINAANHAETGLTKLAVSAPPCGYCRQFLYEMPQAEGLEIIMQGLRRILLGNLLPDAFGPANLGLSGGLLATPGPTDWRLHTVTEADPLARACLDALARSYAPYTHAHGAAAVELSNGRVIASAYLENAAFNPSISPMQAVLVTVGLAGQEYSNISRALVIQHRDSPIDHLHATRTLLSNVSPSIELEELFAEP